jgi:Ca2+-binding EF-hand superfamily protein
MKTSLKIALLLGVVTFAAGAGLGYAQMEGPPPPDGPMQGLGSSHPGRTDRLLRSFDLNHDGRITQAEMNNTIGARFAAATRRAPRMTLEQFLAVRADEFRQHNTDMFRSLDWNADGRLSLAEFAAPQRVRFLTLDRRGTGYVSCAAGGGEHGTSRGGLSGMCADNDLNRDGTVTRAEMDSAIGKRFSQATGGGPAMAASQFAQSEQRRFADVNTRTFRRLDQDNDGMLTVQEFGGTELRLFARLDKNKDRVLAANEISRQGNRNAKRHRYD